jgi:two-component system, OmpR family, sensor histidine kinase MtrB
VDDATREETTMLVTEVRRMQSTLELFLGLARLEGDGFRIHMRQVNLRTLLAVEARSFRERHPGASLEEQLPRRGLLVESDADRVREVVTNLLDNAVDHGGGRVTIALSREDDRAVIAVSDRGPGIPAHVQTHIFERTFRPDSAGSGRGLGLGLYVSRAIAERLGGELTFETAAGCGTTFRLALPIARPRATRSSAAEHVARAADSMDQARLAGGL